MADENSGNDKLRNSNLVFVGRPYTKDEALKLLSNDQEKQKVLSFEVKKESDFKALKEKFFKGYGYCTKEDFVSIVPDSSDVIQRGQNNMQMSVFCKEQKIDVATEIQMSDDGYNIKRVMIRRLVDNPGMIMHINLSEDEFKVLNKLPSVTHGKTFGLSAVIEAMKREKPEEEFFDIYPNAPYAFISATGRKILAYYRASDGNFVKVNLPVILEGEIYDSIKPTEELFPVNDAQAFYQAFLKDNSILCLLVDGAVGSGKTLLALNAGINSKLELIRAVLPTNNEELGWLKGDVSEKIGPFSRIISDGLYRVLKLNKDDYPILRTEETLSNNGNGNGNNGNGSGNGKKSIKDYIEKSKKLTIVDCLSYLQGRNLVNEFIFIDEAQNMNFNELVVAMTRGVGGTRIVCVGDSAKFQIRKNKEEDRKLLHIMKMLAGDQDIACIKLPVCVRNKLGQKLVERVF